MEAQLRMSRHAQLRCRQPGVKQAVVDTILSYHDVDYDIGDNCRLLKISRSAVHQSAVAPQVAEKLPRLAVIWSDRNNRIVTVLHVAGGKAGRRYRRNVGA